METILALHDAYSRPYLHSWGFSQSPLSRTNGAPGLAALETTANSVSASPDLFSFKYFGRALQINL